MLLKPTGYAWWPRFAPEENAIRFTLLDGNPQVNSLWELDLRTSMARRLSPKSGPWSTAAAATWSNDGADFFFHTGQGNGPFTLWWMPGRRSLMTLFASPRRITAGPTNFRAPQPDSNSSALFARGQIPRSEMVRVHLSGGTTELVLPDTFAAVASYSPDDAWVVYYSTNPEEALWKCTAGGTDRQMLIPNPIQSSMPRWSPDGDRIAVSTRHPGEPWRLTIISAADASREELRYVGPNAISPSWSPDGRQIIFGTIPTVEKNPNSVGINILDLGRKQISQVPGSTGMYMPAMSPDGRYIAALRADSNRLNILDVRETKWLPETIETASYLVWAKDSSGVLFVNHDAQGLRIRRCRIPGMEVATVNRLPGFKQFSTWVGLAPHDGFLIARDLSTQEIYQLDLK